MFLTFITTNGLLISFPWVHLAMTNVLLRRGVASGAAAPAGFGLKTM
jgi:hypothetical protein